jgi:hypothetical protein
MRFSIRAKFAVALGLLAVCVMVVAASSFAVLRFNESALADLRERRMRSLLLVRDASVGLKRYIKDVEVAVSTKDPDLLTDDDAVIGEIRAAVDEFRKLNGAPEAAFDERLTAFVATCKRYVLGRTPEAMVETGQRASEQRQELLGALQTLESRAKADFEGEVARIGAFNQQATKASLVLVTLLTVATISLSGGILVTVVRRIRKLGEHFAGTDLE